jgi:hypothetical protein
MLLKMNFVRKFNNKELIYHKSSYFELYIIHLKKILTAT